MRRLSRIVLFATALLGAGGACASNEDLTDATTPKVEAVRPTLAGMVCQPVTILEVAHRVGGRVVTDRVRVADDNAGSAALVLRSFRATALHFGDANVVSSRRITQVQCFPEQAGLTRASGRLTDPPTDGTLCADPFGVYDCSTPTPSQVFDVSSGESCNVRNYSEAVSLSCQDSSAIVTRSGDIVVTVNTENLRNDVLSRTQALRRLVGDENVVANFHFDVVINPDQQAAIIGNQAFNDLAEQIRQASEAGRQIPDVGDFLRWLPQPPANADAYAALTRAQEMMQERLQLLAKVTEGAPLSPQQVNAFYRAFVEKSRLVDRLDVQNSASARNEATSIITETINQLASANRGSPTYEQVKAGAEAMLEVHTSEGVFDPDRTVDFIVPDLQSSLTDQDVEKRMVAAEMLIKLNEVLLRDDGLQRAKDLLPPIQQIVLSLQNDALDRVWRLYDLVEATEFFFDNEDPAGTSYDVHLSHDARALFNIEVAPTSAMAVEVINLLNETAEYDRETGRVTVNYQAIIVINARQALSATDLKKALYLTEASHGILGFLRANAPAFLAGSLKNLGETATGVFYMAGDFIRDPEAFVENLKSAIVNWDQTLEIILDQGLDVIHRWPDMTTEEKSELLGRLAAEVLLSLPAQARRAANVNEVIRDASRLHLEHASRALHLIDRGGVALDPEAAMELLKRLDQYELTNVDEAIRVLDTIDDALPCDLVGGGLPLAPSLVAKPKCSKTQVVNAMEALKVRASKMGVKDPAELKLLTQSMSTDARVINNALNQQELGFSNALVHTFYGTVVGAPTPSYRAIDGFYRGYPLQLKSSSRDVPENVDNLYKQVLDGAHDSKNGKYSYKDIMAGMEMFDQSSHQVIQDLISTGILTQVGEGKVVRSIHIFCHQGREWVVVENGGYQVRSPRPFAPDDAPAARAWPPSGRATQTGLPSPANPA